MASGRAQKILILGGHGFVGKNLATALNKTNHEISIASRTDGVDLANFSDTVQCFDKIKPDIIFNCAAHVGSLHYVTINSADVVNDNVQMSLNIYKAAEKVCPAVKIINPLSNCSYPGAADLQTESDWWNGEVHESVFSYGNSKRILYVLSKCYEIQYKIKTANVLIPNTFGPGDSADPNKTHALNGMILRMLETQKRGDMEFEIWGSGSPIREWAYIDDVVNILIQAMVSKENLIYPVNLGQNRGHTIKQTAEFIAEAVGFKGRMVFNTKYQDGAPVKILDNKKLKQIFPNFKFFDHREGIERTVSYYRTILK